MAESLDEVLADALALLAEGAADPGSAWRNLTLATMGAGGQPQARTLVLRHFDPAARHVHLHTDARSAKHEELAANPLACVHGWDPARQVQLRLTGATTLHTEDDVADAAWAALRQKSRDTYRVQPGPGTELAAPEGTASRDEVAARAVFCVIRLAMDRLDWLHLGQVSHRRACFAWARSVRTSMWLVP